MTEKYIVIVNPNAGNKRGQKDWPVIESFLKKYKINYTASFTEKEGHARTICSEQIILGERNFIVVGGDGTLNEVLNGIYSDNNSNINDVVLANIPVGTGNDWCRTYNIKNDIEKAIKIIIKRNIFRQDVGKVSSIVDNKEEIRYFMNVAGMGFDAFVADKTNDKKKEGKGSALIYLYTLFISLFKFKSTIVKIKTPDKNYNDVVFSMSFGIGKYNGGGMMQLPNAVPNDGLLDVTIINKLNKLEVLANIRKLFDGSIIYHPKVETFQSNIIEIESNPHISLEVDGEICGSTPVKIEIIHKGLSVIVPDDF